jgi:hypothetical protein
MKIDFEDLMPHNVDEVICVKCLKRWIAVYPTACSLKELECPNCGKGFVIKTGEEIDAD